MGGGGGQGPLGPPPPINLPLMIFFKQIKKNDQNVGMGMDEVVGGGGGEGPYPPLDSTPVNLWIRKVK